MAHSKIIVTFNVITIITFNSIITNQSGFIIKCTNDINDQNH